MHPHIRVGILADFRSTVERLGGDIDQVLSIAGLPHRVLLNPEHYIPYPSYLKLLDSAASRTGCPHFGLEMSRYLGAESLGVAGFVMSQARDVGAAWKTLQNLYRVHNTYAVVVQTESEKMAYVRYEIPRYDVPGSRQAIDVAAGISVNIHRMLCGGRSRPQALYFPYESPENLEPYQTLDCPKLEFSQLGFAMAIPLETLKWKIRHSDPLMKSVVQAYLSSVDDDASKTTSGQVEKLIRGLLPSGKCTSAHVAGFLSVSLRTLQNRLETEHTSFQALLDRIRRELALDQMDRGDLKLTQIAFTLGYSELSAFSRSFKRWYGVSPREWLRQHK